MSGKIIWKTIFKGREKSGMLDWSGKFGKDFKSQGCFGQEKIIWKTIFKGREKSGMLDWSGKFGKDFKSQEIGKLIAKYTMHILFKGKGLLSREIVQAHLLSHWRLLCKERICPLGEHILSFKVAIDR